jgi:hypothetical protein
MGPCVLALFQMGWGRLPYDVTALGRWHAIGDCLSGADYGEVRNIFTDSPMLDRLSEAFLQWRIEHRIKDKSYALMPV